MSVSQEGKRRSPGTYSRGEETRSRIIDAAIELFAQYGFEGTSTRSLAERANVNLPAIQYYFGSKEGLYRAVFEHVREGIPKHMRPMVEQVDAILPRESVPRTKLHTLLIQLLDTFLLIIVEMPKTSRLLFFRAEFEQPELLGDLLYESMWRHVVRPCVELIARLSDSPANDRKIIVGTMLIVGQITMIGRIRSRQPHPIWGELGPEEIETVRTLIREQTATLLRTARRSSSAS